MYIYTSTVDAFEQGPFDTFEIQIESHEYSASTLHHIFYTKIQKKFTFSNCLLISLQVKRTTKLMNVSTRIKVPERPTPAEQ